MRSEFANIVLVGFMGAGKTTVGRELERLTGFRMVDLDAEIVRRRGREIPDIFASEGEDAFRDYETDALRSLGGCRRIILATGGGVVGRPDNWRLMRRLGPVVYLRATWECLWKRIAGACGRPLAGPGKDAAQVKGLWEKRLPLYEQADLVVDSDHGSAAHVADAVLKRLEERDGAAWRR